LVIVPGTAEGSPSASTSFRRDVSVRLRNKCTRERVGRTGPWSTHATSETVVVVENPTRWERQGDLRCRFWAPVPELGGRYLRVVTLADKVTILNAFPDRGFKP